jgi:3-deoxy-D-manno-octulosonic-acid transferase
MILSFLYELVLIFLGLLALPKLLYLFLFQHKYRKSLLKRFGSGFPLIKKGKRPLVWIHAVSLGETKAVATLTKILNAELNHPIIVFSTTTETGHVEACRTIKADYHVYMPFDFGWVIHPIIKRTAPDLVVLCESDFWYNFLKASKKAGALIALVNGKLSTRSQNRFKRCSFFAKSLFSYVDVFCVQNSLYKARFESVGVPSDKIAVTGNIKFDGDYSMLPEEQLNAWRQELGIKSNDLVLVVGSSHHPEETLFLNVMPRIWEQYPNLKVILVPRHPERFNEVAGILQKSNMSFRRLSQRNHDNGTTPVILIDAMGLLRKCYQLADIAIVAGSYTAKVGGHNILEPSWYGVPVIFGPHMHSQPGLVELMKESGAGLQVSSEDLALTLLSLLDNPVRRKQIGNAGLHLISDIHGATEKTWDTLQLILDKSKRNFLASNKR